jgi:hypothetical protein
MKTRSLTASLFALIALSAAPAGAAVITFDDLTLPAESYFRPGVTTTFSSGGATFFHDAPFGPCCWSGFSYSNKSDTTTPGFLNDGSAITGTGVGPGQDNYAIAYGDGARLRFAAEVEVKGAFFTNTTYSFLAMRDGNDGAGFVKGPFGPGDFFTLLVTGIDAADAATGTVEVPLAVGADVLGEWKFFDLIALGVVRELRFGFASSDVGPFGINTPVYFAMDNLEIVPLPGGVWLLGSALLLLGRRRVQGD